MTRTRMRAILGAAALLGTAGSIGLGATPALADSPVSVPPDQLAGVAVHADSGQVLGVIDHVIEGAGGPAARVAIAVAGADHKLVVVPSAQLRVTTRSGPVDVVAGYGVTGTAAPGVTGPFGTAHLASTGAAIQVQPEGGPPGTMIVLPGATAQSLLAMPAAK